MAKLRQVIFKAACFYSVASLVYVALVALMVKGNTTVADAYSLVLGNLAVLFGYSLVFGASFLLFDAAKLPQSARRQQQRFRYDWRPDVPDLPAEHEDHFLPQGQRRGKERPPL